MNKNRITVADAAKHLGISDQFVRLGLQRKELPIGTAVKTSSRWTYYINRIQLEEFSREEFSRDKERRDE